jgi:hypothetical protein
LPKVFATRVWGFTPDVWPVASFGSDGICKHLLSRSDAGDLLVFVGTKGPPTIEKEQGRILGYCMFGRDIVDTDSVLTPEVLRPEAYNERGELRWPRCMVMVRAWKIDSNPLPELVATIGRQLERMATTYAVPLSEDEAGSVMALPASEVALVGTRRFDDLKRKTERLAGRSIGPIPTILGREATQGRGDEPAFVYAFRFGRRNCFKIGWAYDWQSRLNSINAHIPYELLGEKWEPYLAEKFSDATSAYSMEQELLDAFPENCIVGERVSIQSVRLDTAWANALVSHSAERYRA